MPAKKQITRDKILDRAFEMVRESGFDSLNMRTLAASCGCSTQPIYNSFSGSAELRSEVTKMIVAFYEKFIREQIAAGGYPEYKLLGMGYINFARSEREFFKYLFMRQRPNGEGLGEDGFDGYAIGLIKSAGLKEDAAHRLHAEMWVFVHGIAAMYATGYLEWDWDTVKTMMTDVYEGLSARIKGEPQ